MTEGWRQWPAAVARLTPGKPTAWFHAASLGEFEQARPVLETFRQHHPDYQVLVTFFSPSGYEIRKNYTQAEAVCYLPMDLPKNVRRLLDATHPSIAFFVKYEFWFNYLGQLQRRNIPTYLFSSIFRQNQYFFKPWGAWALKQLNRCYTHIFVQNAESLSLLKSHGISHCSQAGDTRFDRVHQIALAAENNEVAEQFLDGYNGKVLVGGSTWPPDEQVLAGVRQTHSEWFPCRVILAPHVINEDHLQQIEQLFPDSVRYSSLKDGGGSNGANVLIIDNIGLLSKLYRYADVAYIGGGFGVGIHNILEAVTFGKPVFFGPNYHKFQEAHDIISCGGGWSIRDMHDLEEGSFQQLLTHPTELEKSSQACLNYMNANLGSTDIILNTIES